MESWNMYRRFFILLVTLMCATGLAQGAETDDCLYNPAAFQDMLNQLHQHYAGSHFSKDHSAVIIPLVDGKVSVAYGGCEDYGTDIKFVAETKTRYSSQEAFARAKELLRRFGQGRVDLKVLQQLWKQKKYEQDPPGVFWVDYPDLHEFNLDFRQTDGHAHIGISFYN